MKIRYASDLHVELNTTYYNISEQDIIKKLNLKDKEISSILASLYDVNKNQVYKRCLDI